MAVDFDFHLVDRLDCRRDCLVGGEDDCGDGLYFDSVLDLDDVGDFDCDCHRGFADYFDFDHVGLVVVGDVHDHLVFDHA